MMEGGRTSDRRSRDAKNGFETLRAQRKWQERKRPKITEKKTTACGTDITGGIATTDELTDDMSRELIYKQ